MQRRRLGLVRLRRVSLMVGLRPQCGYVRAEPAARHESAFGVARVVGSPV